MAPIRPLSTLLCSLLLALTAAACSDDGEGNGNGNGGGSDTGRDAVGGDGSEDGEADTGPELPPMGENLRITFVTLTRGANQGEVREWKLWVTDEGCDDWPGNRCNATEIRGGGLSCQVECRVAPNFNYVLWVDPDVENQLRIAPLGADLSVGEDRVLAQGVVNWDLGPERVVFGRRDGEIRAVNFSGGDEWRVGSFDSPQRPGLMGGFHYAPHIDSVIVNVPTSLSAMDLREIGVTDPTRSRLLYHFVSDIEQTTGSFYQGQMDIAVSQDGSVIAVITKALDTTNPCDPNATSTTCDPEYTCSRNSNRCIGEQMLLHILNRTDANLLSVPGNLNACTSDAECGQYHDCDRSNPDASNRGICTPGKRVLGPQGRFACGLDAAGGPMLDPGEYNNAYSLMWRADGALMFVGSNSCAGRNIPITNLVAIDPSLDALELVIANPNQDHGGPDCYDPIEEEYNPAGCNVAITRARMSPSGQTVVFIASSVRSQTDTEVWIIDAWGRGGKDDLTRDILTEILRVGVFAP
jgi:hypothetical protein